MAEEEDSASKMSLDMIASKYPQSEFASSNTITTVSAVNTVHTQNTLTISPTASLTMSHSSHPPLSVEVTPAQTQRQIPQLITKRSSNSLPPSLIGVPPLRETHLMVNTRHSLTPNCIGSFFKSPTSRPAAAVNTLPAALDLPRIRTSHSTGSAYTGSYADYYSYAASGHAHIQREGHNPQPHGQLTKMNSLNAIHTLNMNIKYQNTNPNHTNIPARAGFFHTQSQHRFQPISPVHSHSKLVQDNQDIAQVILQPPIILQNTCTTPGALYECTSSLLPNTDLLFNESVERPRTMREAKSRQSRHIAEIRRPQSARTSVAVSSLPPADTSPSLLVMITPEVSDEGASSNVSPTGVSAVQVEG